MDERALDRFRGCLLGLAVGDAVGTTLEFKRPCSFAPITDMIGGGPFHLKPGQWTDDTSMALCLAASLVEKGFDPVDQLRGYVRWWREGYFSSTGEFFDIGGATAAALREFEDSGNPFCGSEDPRTAGNGSIMRLAPVPMYYAGKMKEAVACAADSSRTTHAAKEAVDACRFMAAVLVKALNGASKEELLSPGLGKEIFSDSPLAQKIEAIRQGSYKLKEPPAIRGTGYAVDCLEAALWAFNKAGSFKEGVLLAANLGDDADTTAAVYGQISGAFYGEKGIPGEWLAKLHMRPEISSLAEKLAAPR